MLNENFKDMLSAFGEAGADYLLVGAYAMAAHGCPRATADIRFLGATHRGQCCTSVDSVGDVWGSAFEGNALPTSAHRTLSTRLALPHSGSTS